MPCCEISDCAQMSKTIIAVRHFGLGGRKSLETAVILQKHDLKSFFKTARLYINNQAVLLLLRHVSLYLAVKTLPSS